jgi:hypothetical protein
MTDSGYRSGGYHPIVGTVVTNGLASYGFLMVGPVNDGTYKYAIGELMSKHSYHNAASAALDGRRPQRVNDEGLLVPLVDGGYNADLN